MRTPVYLTNLIAGCCLVIVSCVASEQGVVQPIRVQLSENISAMVSVGYDDRRGHFALSPDANLGRLFDGKTDSYWTSETRGCQKVGISITLEKPVYLKTVKIIHHGKVFPTIGNVIIDQATDEDTYSNSGRNVKLNLSEKQEIDVGNEYFLSVLKGKVISVFLLDCNQPGEKLEIAEINFELSDVPTMKPELTAKEIKSTVKALMKPNTTSWNFVDDENEPNKEKYLAHLMYYGLRGDTEAEELFMAYNPKGTDLSEDQSALESWFEDDMRSVGPDHNN